MFKKQPKEDASSDSWMKRMDIKLKDLSDDLYADLINSPDIQQAVAEEASFSKTDTPLDVRLSIPYVELLTAITERDTGKHRESHTRMIGNLLYHSQQKARFIEPTDVYRALCNVPTYALAFGIYGENDEYVVDNKLITSAYASVSGLIVHAYDTTCTNHNDEDSIETFVFTAMSAVVPMLIWRYNENGGPLFTKTQPDLDISSITD